MFLTALQITRKSKSGKQAWTQLTSLSQKLLHVETESHMGSLKEAEEEWSAIQGQLKLHNKNMTRMKYIKHCLKPKT